MALPPQQPTGPNYTYVDLPEISETFVDTLERMLFDGQTLRMTFAVNRMDNPEPPKPTTGKRHPVCRIVMTAAAAAEFVNKIRQLETALAQGQRSTTKPSH